MQKGNFVADVAYYYGNEAPLFVGHKRIFPWLGEGYDYDVINTEILLDRIEVVNGRLMLPHGQSYSVLVLPDDERMDLDVLKKIESLVEQGATVVGPKPNRIYGLNEFETQEKVLKEIVTDLWGDCDSISVKMNAVGKGKIVWGKTPRIVLEESSMGPDFSYVAEEEIKLEYIHREFDDIDIYFVRNADSVEMPVETIFRTIGAPELWDPDNGEITPIPVYKIEEKTTRLPLMFSPYESYVVVFRKNLKRDHINEISYEGTPVFPGGNGPGYVRNADGDFSLLFESAGNYEIEYSNGMKDQFAANQILQEIIAGPWDVSFSKGWDAPENITFSALVPWNKYEDSGIQTYSGIASYKTSFQTKKTDDTGGQWFLDLGQVYEVADVNLNGINLGIRSFVPYSYNITPHFDQDNELVIEVANLLNNQLVGEGRKPKEQRKTKSNVIRLPSPWSIPMGEAPLLESGLIGPVRLIKYQAYKPKL